MDIKKKIDSIKKSSITLKQNGFFSIFIAQVINKILLFSSSIIIVRLISKEDYGLYSYAYNIVSMFLLVNGFGAISGFLQFGSEYYKDKEKSRAYEKYTFRFGLTSSSILSILILLFSLFSDAKIENSNNLLMTLALIPLFNFVFSFYETKLRVYKSNKKYSFLLNLNSLIYFLGIIVGSISFGIYGIVISKYLSFAISAIYGLLVTRKASNKTYQICSLSKVEKKEFLKISLVSTINNAISQMLYLLDVFIIGYILVDASIIASYKTATLIPFALTFIPLSVMVYSFPYYASHNKDMKYIRSYTKKMIPSLIILNGLITFMLVFFSNFIINTIFGAEYSDARLPFVILSIGFFISGSFRIPFGNILAAMKKVYFNFFVAILSGITNIILNYYLVLNYGSVGAAYSTVIIFLITSIMSVTYFLSITNKKNFQEA